MLIRLLTAATLTFTLALISVVVPETGQVAYAQDDEKRDPTEGRQTKKTPAMREKVYKRLAAAQEAMEAKDMATAQKELQALRNEKDLKPYEAAQMWNFYAYLYVEQDNYPQAIKAYEQVLAQPDLPEAMERSTKYGLAQLYISQEQYKEGAAMLEEWLKDATKPPANAYMMLAQAYYQMKDFKTALPRAQRAVAIEQEAGNQVREQWWLVMRSLYYELNDIPKVAEVLELLVRQYPKKEYWTMLSAMYSELDQPKKQLNTLELAYRQNMLDRDQELVMMAQLLLQAEVPWKASQVLQKGFDDGVVKKNVTNYRLLAQAYQLAQEDEKALSPLSEAARRDDDGELQVRLAQSHLNLNNYREAIKAARAGLKKGGVKRPDNARIIIGMALYELKEYEAAKREFRLAARDERSERTANQWSQFLDKEIERRDQLRRALADDSGDTPPPEEGEEAPEADAAETGAGAP